MSESELLPVEQVDREMAKRVLRGWLENTPSYAGDDPRASHYRRNAQALEIALAALSTTPAEKLAEALREMVYETTSLSPCEDNGDHWWRITGPTLEAARAALALSHGGQS